MSEIGCKIQTRNLELGHLFSLTGFLRLVHTLTECTDLLNMPNGDFYLYKTNFHNDVIYCENIMEKAKYTSLII